MYSIEEIINSNSNLNHVIIKNEKIDLHSVIYPNLGASLQKLTSNGIEIIDGITANEEGLIAYKNKYNSSFLFPFPNRVAYGKYAFNTTNYEMDCNEIALNNSLHGHIYNKSFSIIEKNISGDIASVAFSYSNYGTTKGFPFSYKLEIKYTFSNGKLSIDFDIYNTGESAYPFGIGWHPYFNSNNLNESMLDFEADKQYELDGKMIPQSETPLLFKTPLLIQDTILDDCFITKQSKASFKTTNYNIRIDFSTKTPHSFLQVYTPPDRNSIAIEPMTCAPNSFNNKNGLLILEPNNKYKWNINLEYST